MVLEGVDEVADVALVAGGDEGAREGGTVVQAVGAHEVGPLGHGGFGAADQAGGVPREGEALVALLADLAVAGGAAAEEAVARVDGIEQPPAPAAQGQSEMPSVWLSRVTAAAPMRPTTTGLAPSRAARTAQWHMA